MAPDLDHRLGADVGFDFLPVAVVPVFRGGRVRRRAGDGRPGIFLEKMTTGPVRLVVFASASCFPKRGGAGVCFARDVQVDCFQKHGVFAFRPRFARLGDRVRFARLRRFHHRGGGLHRGEDVCLVPLPTPRCSLPGCFPSPTSVPGETRAVLPDRERGLFATERFP